MPLINILYGVIGGIGKIDDTKGITGEHTGRTIANQKVVSMFGIPRPIFNSFITTQYLCCVRVLDRYSLYNNLSHPTQ